MTKIILHGGYAKIENELNKKFIKEIAKGLPKEFKILVVLFAVAKNRHQKGFKEHRNLFLKHIKNKNPIFILATEKNFINEIKQADVVYLRGGNNIKLLNFLKKYPNFKEKIKDKVVAGSSAGAYALSKYFYSNDKGKGGFFAGLGILPVAVICHLDKKKNKMIPRFKQFSGRTKLVLLKNFEHKVFLI